MTAPGPIGGWHITDICTCHCHRTPDPEDIMCRCAHDDFPDEW